MLLSNVFWVYGHFLNVTSLFVFSILIKEPLSLVYTVLGYVALYGSRSCFTREESREMGGEGRSGGEGGGRRESL